MSVKKLQNKSVAAQKSQAKMAKNQLNSLDIFESRLCGVCGSEDISQYFNINDNYIEYCGKYLPLREVLSESLDIRIDHNAGKTVDICLDCKDKVIKFYHFKRKVKEVQNSHRILRAQQDKQKISQKPSKVVHNIYKIIESYTEKCSVAAVRVDEDGKKLIIEANDVDIGTGQRGSNFDAIEIKQEPESDLFEETNEHHEQFQFSEGSIFSEDLSTSNSESVIMIKEEPDDFADIIFQSETTSRYPAPPPLPPTAGVARKKTSSSSAAASLTVRQLSSMSMQSAQSSASALTMRSFQQAFHHQNRRNRRSDRPVSAAAVKMRLYREKLKQPENRDKFLQHQQKQKEWNRQYYQRKMMKDMLSGNDMSPFMYS